MTEPRKMLTLKQVLRIVPLSRSTVLAMEAAGRFPRGRMLSGNRKAWFEDEISHWQDTRPPSGAGSRDAA
jgi:prophage regulatory protein